MKTDPPLFCNCEKHRTEIRLPGSAVPADAIGPDAPGSAAADEKEVLSDTQELYRNWEKGTGWIDTGRSKSVFGTFRPGETITLKGAEFTFNGGFATVTLSSLSGEDLKEARLILITAVGRADNSGAVYNPSHTERISMGHGPVIFEVIEGKIRMESSVPSMKLWSIDPDGAYTGEVPSTFKDGFREFVLGETYPSIYYLLSI